MKTTEYNQIVIQKTILVPDIKADEIYNLETASNSSWMSPIVRYLHEDELRQEELEAKKVRK